MHFLVRWPDNSTQRCYSPSLIIADYLEPGESYQVDQLIERCSEALGIASERVRAKYGFACTAAAQQLDELRDKAVGFQPADLVAVEGFER
jgi:uncharacterized repeat protein (TIGR04042 family)